MEFRASPNLLTPEAGLSDFYNEKNNSGTEFNHDNIMVVMFYKTL